jgi:phytoene synthase
VTASALSLTTEPAELVLRKNSRSFALAAALLQSEARERVATLYAWCRRADDAIDMSPPREQPGRLWALRGELDSIYAGRAQSDTSLRDLQRVVFECRIPASYPRALLDGFEMDVLGVRYGSLLELSSYCFRVAGVVGVMLCHVLGVSDLGAPRYAARLGMAMQLTNICRDVFEDWQLERLYVPDELLAMSGASSLRSELGGPLPRSAQRPLARALEQLLTEAERLYRSADAGIRFLPPRARLGVRVARHVYAEIGALLRARGCDVFSGRAVVSTPRKAVLVASSAFTTLLELPSAPKFRALPLVSPLRFPDDVLP